MHCPQAPLGTSVSDDVCAGNPAAIPERRCTVVMAREHATQSPSCNVPVVGDDTGIGDQMRGPDLSVIPDRCGAVVVAPEDVALAVAVEVAGFGKMPAVGDGAGVGDQVSP